MYSKNNLSRQSNLIRLATDLKTSWKFNDMLMHQLFQKNVLDESDTWSLLNVKTNEMATMAGLSTLW